MKIQNLYSYPIKSTQGINLKEVNITKIGFENDRYFGIADTQNKIITARENPKLLQIHTEINRNNLTIHFGNESQTVDISNEHSSIKLFLFNKETTGKVFNNKINIWLSQILDAESKLVTIDNNQLRVTEGTPISFSDCYPIHLISEDSVNALNNKLNTPVEINRFRPNIIISGLKPFEEENWTHLTIGTCEFKVISQTERCTLITINPFTGQKDKKQEPLRTLAKEFKSNDKVNFGIYLKPIKTGEIRKTDVIEVFTKKN